MALTTNSFEMHHGQVFEQRASVESILFTIFPETADGSLHSVSRVCHRIFLAASLIALVVAVYSLQPWGVSDVSNIDITFHWPGDPYRWHSPPKDHPFVYKSSPQSWRPLSSCPSGARPRAPRRRPDGASHGKSNPPRGMPDSSQAGPESLLGGADSYDDPAALLRRAVAHEGDMARMHRLLHKVIVKREPITVLALGTSVTHLSAGKMGPQTRLFNSVVFNPKRNERLPLHGFLSVALDWLVAAYPPAHNHNFSAVAADDLFDKQSNDSTPYWLLNEGVGGAFPCAWSGCDGNTFLKRLPDSIDLVVMEWASSASNVDSARWLDDALQLVLNRWQAQQPALLLVHFFFWCRGNIGCRGYRPNSETGKPEPEPADVPQQPLNARNMGCFSFDSFDPLHTGRVTEDEFADIGRYYGLPVVSMRDAFWHMAVQQVPGYGLYDLIGKYDFGQHPSVVLSRTRYANVLIKFFKDAAQDFLDTEAGLLPHMNSSRPATSPLPLSHPNDPADTFPIVEASDMPAGMAADVALQQLPPPFLRRWFPASYSSDAVRETLLCYSYDMPLGTNAPVRAMQGFNVTMDPDTDKKKPGLIAWRAGSFVEFLLDTRVASKHLHLNSSKAAEVTVDIRYLTSYERMGKAQVSCVEGCECEGKEIDGLTQQHFSVPGTSTFNLTQSQQCVMRVEVMKGEGGEKFKILSVWVSFIEQ